MKLHHYYMFEGGILLKTSPMYQDGMEMLGIIVQTFTKDKSKYLAKEVAEVKNYTFRELTPREMVEYGITTREEIVDRIKTLTEELSFLCDRIKKTQVPADGFYIVDVNNSMDIVYNDGKVISSLINFLPVGNPVTRKYIKLTSEQVHSILTGNSAKTFTVDTKVFVHSIYGESPISGSYGLVKKVKGDILTIAGVDVHKSSVIEVLE